MGPQVTVPQHIHFEVVAPGHRERVTELLFDGDPLLTEGARQKAAREGFVVAEVKPDEGGVTRCVFDLALPE